MRTLRMICAALTWTTVLGAIVANYTIASIEAWVGPLDETPRAVNACFALITALLLVAIAILTILLKGTKNPLSTRAYVQILYISALVMAVGKLHVSAFPNEETTVLFAIIFVGGFATHALIVLLWRGFLTVAVNSPHRVRSRAEHA